MIVDISTVEAEDEAVEETAKQVATRKSGEKGGKVRAQNLMPEQRSEIARTAAAARWKKSRAPL